LNQFSYAFGKPVQFMLFAHFPRKTPCGAFFLSPFVRLFKAMAKEELSVNSTRFSCPLIARTKICLLSID
jgi:hypothetical protein